MQGHDARVEPLPVGALAEYERSIIRHPRPRAPSSPKPGRLQGSRYSAVAGRGRTARERRALGVPLARLVRDHGVAKSTMVGAPTGNGVYGEAAYRELAELI